MKKKRILLKLLPIVLTILVAVGVIVFKDFNNLNENPTIKEEQDDLVRRKVYLLSNAQEIFTMHELEKLGLIEYFDGIAISSKYGVRKPNLKFYKDAIKQMGVEGDIMMVGNDYECDVLPALKLGLKSVFIETNLTPKNNAKEKVRGFRYKKVLKEILSKF